MSCSWAFSTARPELEELTEWGTIVELELISRDELLPGGDNRSRAMSLVIGLPFYLSSTKTGDRSKHIISYVFGLSKREH